jgi:hypothetical protein
MTSIHIVALAQLTANAFKPTLHVKARNSAVGEARRPYKPWCLPWRPGDFEPDDQQAEADGHRRAVPHLAPRQQFARHVRVG